MSLMIKPVTYNYASLPLGQNRVSSDTLEKIDCNFQKC